MVFKVFKNMSHDANLKLILPATLMEFFQVSVIVG